MSGIAERTQEINPFLPGAGTRPPFLAGRDEDLAVFSDCLRRLEDESTPAGPMVLFAPRGDGKTVLLEEMCRVASKKGAACVSLSPMGIKTHDAMVTKLAHILSEGQVSQELGMSASGQVGFPGVAGAGGDFNKKWDVSPQLVAEVLKRFSQVRPVVIAVDEAHTLTHEAGSALLQAEQEARVAGAKVQLLLAGTPDLKDHLGGMGVSFWNRLGKRLRHINLLCRDDAAESVERPFQDAWGVSLDEDAKDRIFELTSGYPYFLQLMGEALWDGRVGAAQTITRRHVDAVEQDFLDGKNAYYQDRKDELSGSGMLGAAFAVALAHRELRGSKFSALKLAKTAQIGAKLDIDVEGAEDAPSTAREMARFLLHKGFMWQTSPTSGQLVPGIPTLMDFVREDILSEFPDAESRLLRNGRFRELVEGVMHTNS